jgi:hypothetical protein
VFKVTVFRKNADVVYGVATMIVPELNSRQNSDLPIAERLQLPNPGNVHYVVVGDSYDSQAELDKGVDDLLVRNAFVVVVEGTWRMEMQVPTIPRRPTW